MIKKLNQYLGVYMSYKTTSRLSAGLIFCASLFTYSIAAQAQCDKPVGHFASLQSVVDLQRNNTSDWNTAKLSDHLCEGDTVRVGKKSRAAIQLANDAVLRLDQNTTMRLLSVTNDPKKRSFLQVIKGVFQSFTRKPHHLSVQTPYLNGLIEGTEFLVKVDADQSSILLLEGKIVAKNDQGTVTIMPGQEAVATKGEAPKTVLVAKPLDAVQWTLHYPALLKLDTSGYVDSGWQGAVKQSIAAYKAGDLKTAFSSIANLNNVNDARFYDYRASLLLTVGRVDDARKDLQQALSLSAKDSDALSLQAIIAVAQNEQDKAMASATQATQAAPGSATAFIALSYAQQAKFDLDGAKASLEKAVKLDPKNALAWARLAEIYSSYRELDLSLSAAQKAVALDPNLSRTQTVLGFIDLTRVDTKGASAAFDNAIKLDQTDPLPRLGLGLAKIAEGDLHGGQRELDIAAILDPNKAIIRSYLGKAYYEEKRDGLAAQQFDIAKRLDPKDPTPWFYDAIAKQTQNQPVEALHSMDQAIALNDNRAVYRSKLLLDSDLASRSTSQARIYNDLGFQQLALVEGWQSTNTDPTNYSAHRFLADSYSSLPNHEIARVSELLQSQLLQPLNMTPIQPQSGVSNLFQVSAGGAGSVSYNEYNPLFYQNGNAMQFSGMFGGNNTSSVEAVAAGVHDNVSYSVGGFKFNTDGFRLGSAQDQTIGNAFIQAAISPQTSIQAEYRNEDLTHGDPVQRYEPTNYTPSFVQQENNSYYRFGLRHDFSAQSTLLASFIYSDNYATQRYTSPSGYTLFSTEVPQKSRSGELQYLFRANSFNITGGMGAFSRDGTFTNTISAATFIPGPNIPAGTIFVGPTTTPDDLKHSNAYIYSNIEALNSLTLTLGLSAEFSSESSSSFEKTPNDRDQYNPKFGLTWHATKNTTVRMAAFRAVKRPYIANQSLEPTQIAGFNQFYDDTNNTVSRRYGIAIDQTFSTNLHGGIEATYRDIDNVYSGINTTTGLPEHYVAPSNVHRQRAYLFWTPANWLGLSLDYRLQHFGSDPQYLNRIISDFDSDRLALGMNVFLTDGWSFSVTPQYYDQKGLYFNETLGTPDNVADSQFWIVDANIRYRLPKRIGFISAGFKNLNNQDFKYIDTDTNNFTVQPGRVFYTSATIALP